MSQKRPRKRDALLVRVWAELGSGRIREDFLYDRSNRTRIHGETYRDGEIVINPAHVVAETVVHEIVHRLFPDRKERGVTRTANRLFRLMTDEEIREFYLEYQRRVKKA